MALKRGHQLYLIRHGLAEERGDAWPDDRKRPLTAQGVARLRKSVRGLRRLGVDFDLIVCSPLVRARQTADVFAESQALKAAVLAVDALAPGGSAAAVLAELEQHRREAVIGIVGHEPGIGELASKLIGLRHPMEFKKGAVCRIDVDTLPPTGPGALRWLMPSRVLRRLA